MSASIAQLQQSGYCWVQLAQLSSTLRWTPRLSCRLGASGGGGPACWHAVQSTWASLLTFACQELDISRPHDVDKCDSDGCQTQTNSCTCRAVDGTTAAPLHGSHLVLHLGHIILNCSNPNSTSVLGLLFISFISTTSLLSSCISSSISDLIPFDAFLGVVHLGQTVTQVLEAGISSLAAALISFNRDRRTRLGLQVRPPFVPLHPSSWVFPPRRWAQASCTVGVKSSSSALQQGLGRRRGFHPPSLPFVSRDRPNWAVLRTTDQVVSTQNGQRMADLVTLGSLFGFSVKFVVCFLSLVCVLVSSVLVSFMNL